MTCTPKVGETVVQQPVQEPEKDLCSTCFGPRLEVELRIPFGSSKIGDPTMKMLVCRGSILRTPV